MTKTKQMNRIILTSGRFVTIILSLNALTANIVSAADRRNPDFEVQMLQIANEEFNAARTELDRELATTQAKLTELAKAKERVIQTSVALAASEEKGIDFFNKYLQLITLKYLDKQGNFEPKSALSDKDVQNINNVFNNYLHTVPFTGKVSAGIASKKISNGLETLKQNIGMHSKPDVENNSDIAILVKEEETHRERIKVIQTLLSKFPEVKRSK